MEKEIKMSGYDLVRRVLEHEHGGVEALLSLSGNDESRWLELKAGLALLPDGIKKGDKPQNLGEVVAVILVKPVKPCIKIGAIEKIEQILIRDVSEVGHVKQITGVRPMTEYEASERKIEDSYFASLYARFLREAEKSSDDEIIKQAIEQYYLKFKAKKRTFFGMSCV